jgi:hypothetical protein
MLAAAEVKLKFLFFKGGIFSVVFYLFGKACP